MWFYFHSEAHFNQSAGIYLFKYILNALTALKKTIDNAERKKKMKKIIDNLAFIDWLLANTSFIHKCDSILLVSCRVLELEKESE